MRLQGFESIARFFYDRAVGVRKFLLPLLLLLISASPQQVAAQAVRANSGFRANSLPANDDSSTFNAVALGFTANFFGNSYTSTYVNNNGNVTFDAPLFAYTPAGLTASTQRIIAPFWADVDTYNPSSSVVTYGQDTVNGRPAFGVNYVNVGYYDFNADKLNSFQLVLLDRSDTGAGNFDIEFNYDRIVWETGDLSGGTNGFGGVSAAAGYSNGSGSTATSLEIAGSRLPGSFLDSNPNGLIHRTLNSSVPGRLVFQVRAGVVTCSYSIAPASQSFTASGGNGTISVATSGSCSWTAASNSSFVTVTGGASGTGNGTVSYSVAANTASNSRNGTLTIGGQTFTVNQSGTSGGSTSMSVGPPTLTFSGGLGASVQSQSIRVASSGGTINWTATAAVQSGPSGWLSISPPNGAATLSAASTLTVTVNLSGLTPNLYQGTVTVRDNATGVAFVVLVRATVTTSQGQLVLSQSSFVFLAVVGNSAPPSQTLRVTNTAQGNLQWSIPSADLANAPWLSFLPQAGVSPAGSFSSTSLSVNPGNRTAGTYQALVRVTASGAANDPQLISVTLLVVTGNTTPPRADIAPNGIVFVSQQGATVPLSQTAFMANAGGGTVNFTLQATTTSGGSWLTMLGGGTSGAGIVTGSVFPLPITVNPNGLLPGSFHGKVTMTPSTGAVQEIEVLLMVAPAGTFLQRELPEAAACGATSMDMVVSSIGNGLSLPVSFPRSLLAQLVDNCGGNVSNATVVANIGTLSIVLQSVGGGLYSGTWTPESAASSVTLAFTASHPTLGTAQRSFTVSAGAAAGGATLPLILPDGVVEGAGFTALRPLAPGSIISVFGTSFAAGDNFVSHVPLDRSLGGVSVRIGSEDAPLYYAGPTQVNAQVPFTVHPGETVSVVVNANGRLTAPQNYLVAPNQPGIFQSAGTAAVLDSHFAQISAANPARIGDTIQIFANGLGLVDQTPATGNLSPSFSTVQSPVTVTVGGVQVPVQYQGLAPGFVGLYQVNVVLTSGVPTGDGKAVVITQNGIVSNPNLAVSIPIR